MILLWTTLLLLHRGYALLSSATVQLGEPVTFTCFFPDSEYGSTKIKWYRQSIGDTLKLITTLTLVTEHPTFENGFPPSRFGINQNGTISTLTILKTIQEDEGVYHCGVTTWRKDQWSGTYLSLKGKRTSKYTIDQWPTVSDPVRPGDSMTLQCSVLSDSENKTCPGKYSVFWFGVRSNKSHPNMLYADGNRHDECDRRSDTLKSCVYRFSKSVSSSDAGTYYCAVATCGEILFGDGTKLDIQETSSGSVDVLHLDRAILLLLCAVLAISVIVIAFLIGGIKKNKCDNCNNIAADSLEENVKRSLKRDGDSWVYSAAVFTVMKTGSGGKRGAKAVDRERIYAAVKAFGLD